MQNREALNRIKSAIDVLVGACPEYDKYIHYQKVVVNAETGEVEKTSCSSAEIFINLLVTSVKYTFNVRLLFNKDHKNSKSSIRFVDPIRWEPFIKEFYDYILGDYTTEEYLKFVWEKAVVVKKTILTQIENIKAAEGFLKDSTGYLGGYLLNAVALAYAEIIDYICSNTDLSIYRSEEINKELLKRERFIINALSYGQVDLEAEDFADEEKDNDNADPMEELDKLIGLKNVKEDVKTLVNLVKVRQKRIENKLKVNDMSLHMVFTGNPGTGKTTVARLISKIYKQIGVLSKGTFVEASREDLVAGYVGQTAIKTKHVIDSARGGVLFIDEAYSLNGDGDRDFGKEAISTLLKEMEDNRGDLIVIVAGYPDLTEEFLKSNPGLKSRFNKFINFEDYTEDELEQIYELISKEEGYTIELGVKDALKKKLSEVKDSGNFANARSVRNIFEKSLANQANRIVKSDDYSVEALQLLTVQDIEYVVDTSKKEEKKTIGFGIKE